MRQIDLVIVGGGPAGMSAAVKAHEQGLRDILIIERNKELGGILRQCIHNGFGLHVFGDELTGPEYSHRFAEKVREYDIPHLLNAMVLDITPQKIVTVLSQGGVEQIQAKAVILAMGCRERPRGALNIPGSRAAGIYTAGTAQDFVNMRDKLPGREVVILGSGDIGLIMARRMTLEGAEVKCVAELMPYSGGLKRNIAQCLNDYGIPLRLSHTVTKIVGRDRVEGVYLAEVDKNRLPIDGTEEFIACDTLLLSVGLIPENELSKKAGVELSPITGGAVVDSSLETSISGIFSCGNVLHVHDLVDYVTTESYEAAVSAVDYINNGQRVKKSIPINCENGIRYVVPHSIDALNLDSPVELKLRVDGVYDNCYLTMYFDGERVLRQKKRVLTPGEMEKIKIKQELLYKIGDTKKITVKIEY